MKRYTPELCSRFEPGQVIKTVSSTSAPEAVYPGAKQAFTVQTVADVDGALAGKFFDININENGAIARVYITVDGEGTAPARPDNGRLLVVDIDADDSADNVAAAIKLVVDADADLVATVVTDTITVTQAAKGERGLPLAQTSGFTIVQTAVGLFPKLFVPSFSLTGKKDRSTDNTGVVYFGFSSTNDTQKEVIAAGKTVVVRAPEGSVIDLGKVFIDVATNNDGVVVSWPAVERGV